MPKFRFDGTTDGSSAALVKRTASGDEVTQVGEEFTRTLAEVAALPVNLKITRLDGDDVEREAPTLDLSQPASSEGK